MKRREFCKKASSAGSSLLLAPLVSACRRIDGNVPASSTVPVTPTASSAPEHAQPTIRATPLAPGPSAPDPTATTEPKSLPTSTTTTGMVTSLVALVKTENRAAGVARAVELLKLDPFQGQSVLLKPNFNSADPSPGSTHPDILQALLKQLSELRAGPVTLADRSGMGDTRQVMEQTGVFDLAHEFNCQTIVLDELAEDDWFVFHQPGLHWQDGFPVPKMLLDAPRIVQTCNLKTHRYGGHFTMSLKNSVGFVAKSVTPGGYDYMSELHSSPHQRLMIAEINATYEPDLVVIDAVEAFVQGGPATGKTVAPGVVLAGRDRVALDAVGVAILRLFGTTPEVRRGRIFEQQQIARAAELGLGVAGPEQIEFVTPDEDSARMAAELSQLLHA